MPQEDNIKVQFIIQYDRVSFNDNSLIVIIENTQ